MTDAGRFFAICAAAFMVLVGSLPIVNSANAQQYAADGVALTPTFRIRSKLDNTYLKSSGRYISATATLAPNDDSFLWVFVDSNNSNYTIANVATGWILIRPRNSASIYATVPEDGHVQRWDVEDGTSSYQSINLLDSYQPNRVAADVMLISEHDYMRGEARDIGLKREGGSATARPAATKTDPAFVWTLEPGPARDLIKIEIESVKAIQTSTGRDGATNVLTGGIVLALEWGPTIASSGAAGAIKGAVSGLAKKLGTKGAQNLAKKSLKEVAKEALEKAAREGFRSTASNVGKAVRRGYSSGARFASSAVRKATSKIGKAGSSYIKKKKTMLLRYRKNPKAALTLKNLGKTLKRSKSLTKKGLDAEENIAKLKEGFNNTVKSLSEHLLAKQGVTPAVIAATSAATAAGKNRGSGRAGSSVALVVLQSLEPDDHELGLARMALLAMTEFDTPEISKLRNSCDSYVGFAEPPSPVKVVTPKIVSEVEGAFKEMQGALAAAGAEVAAKEVDAIVLESFLNPFGSAMDTIVAMTNDTDDSLEIELNGSSVWPNGGGDWRDISKGSTKNVGVKRILPRTAGVNIHLIEYDYASADDNLGNLKFDTAGLREAEHHSEALVHSSSEGSLYGVTFSVAPVSTASSLQEVEAHVAINACMDLEEKLYKIQRKVDAAYDKLEKYVAVPQLILKSYGIEGLTAFNNARAYHLTEKVCPDDSADYGKLLAGDWRLGEFDNLAGEKLQPTKSTVTFSADGTLLGSGEGTWEKVPNKCELKIGRFSYDKRMFVQSEGDGVTLYTDTDYHLVNNVMRFARWKYADTDYTDENGVLHVAKPEGIDGGGRGDWLEKIETHPLPASLVNSNEKNAQAALFGHWKIKIPSPPEGAENYDAGHAIWTFTSDKIFVSSLPDAKRSKDGPDPISDTVTGRWEYLGDRRIKVTLDGEFSAKNYGVTYNGIGNSFVVYIDTNGYGYRNLKEYTKDSEFWGSKGSIYVHRNNPDGSARTASSSGVKNSKVLIGESANWGSAASIHYWIMAGYKPENTTIETLMAYRKKHGLPVPEGEVADFDKYLSARILQARNPKLIELFDEDLARREKKHAELEEIWTRAQSVIDLHVNVNAWEARCGKIGAGNKHKFVGDWTVALYGPSDERTELADNNAKWSFKADGSLTGSYDGTPWVATWSEIDKCLGKAAFDAATAKNYNLETEIELQVRFTQNGDRRLFVLEHDPLFNIEKKKFESPAAAERVRELTDHAYATKTSYGGRFDNHVPNFRIEQKNIDEISKKRLETEAELQLRRLRAGDRKLYTVKEGEAIKNLSQYVADEALVADGFYEVFEDTVALTGVSAADAEDHLRFIVNYEELNITRAGLANRCSKRWVNNEIGPGKAPKGRRVGFDVRSVIGPSYNEFGTVTVYRVNFEGPEAEGLYRGSVGDTGKSWEAKIGTHGFEGVIGDEFAILDHENNCVKLVQTTNLLTTPVKDRFEFSGINSAETALYFDNDLTPQQQRQGCEGYQWAQHSELVRSDVVRKIGNTNSYDIFVYAIDKDGKYLSKTPVLTVKPGTFGTLNAVEGELYPIFKKDFTCEAVATIRSNRWDHIVRWRAEGWPQSWNPNKMEVKTDNPQMIFGDGSTPITSPDLVTPDQIANGCLEIGKAASVKRSLGTGMRVANSGPSDLSVHWIGYNGQYDAKRPVLSLKPGETGRLTDFEGAKYQIMDEAGACVAIVEPPYENSQAGGNTELKTFGDNSTPVTGVMVDANNRVRVDEAVPLSKHQIANGCTLYGNISSRPSSNNGWDRIIVNAGARPLTVQWLSFYGALEDSEKIRAAKPTLTIAPGQQIRTDKSSDSDVFAVLDGDQCVAVIQAQDLFTEDASVPSRVTVNPYSDRKTYYVLRDRKSAAEFDLRVAQWNLDKKNHKEKLDELEGLWADSNCGEGGSGTDQWGRNYTNNNFGELVGRWEVGSYDRGGGRKQFDVSPGFWTFTSPFHIEGNLSGGRTFTKTGIPRDCALDGQFAGSDKLKFVFKSDGSKIFFVTYDNLPEVLYSDGTTDRPSMYRQVDASSSTNVRIKREPHLGLWGRKLPSISKLTDSDASTEEVGEDAPIGTAVGITALATDPDDKVSYSVANYYGTSSQLFAIDPVTGVVTVAAELDYETARQHKIAIIATSEDTSESYGEFEIAIRAVNETAIGEIVDADTARISDYSYGSYGVEDRMYESAKVGQRVAITALATDNDGNDSVSYSLTDSAGGLFAIDPASGVITVAGKLDWEAVKSHTIEVTASSSDGSTSRKAFEIPLADANEFSVSDVSDTNLRPNVVDESAPIGTPVGVTAFATDADGSATVSYSIDDNRNGTAFKIDSETGVLTLNTDLNREYYADITINVKATSSDGSTSAKTFTIAINDINEFDVTEITNADPYYGIRVREDAEVGAKINLDADARDEDATDEVTFSIANARDVPFVIDPKSGVVTVSGKSLDEDEISSYTLKIVASSTDGSLSRKSFEVPVEGINEFEATALTDTDETWNAVFENAAGGTPVGITAFAEDRDGTDTVTYEISDRWSNFEIDPVTGVISVGRYGSKLDTETKPVETVSVVATSSDRTQSWQTFEITISNVNDFEVSRPYDVDNAPNEVPENSAIGTVVGVTAFAEDGDAGDTITYQLAESEYGHTDDGLFAIDPDTGVVTVAAPIDFEGTWRSSITVRAVSSDGMEPSDPFAAPVTPFEIRIIPVNEFDLTPFVDTDNAPNEVSDTAEWNTPVGITVSTSDADQDLYGTPVIKFAVVDANGNENYDQPFIVEDDGKVAVYDTAKLTALGEGEHSIYVRAKSSDGSIRIEEFVLTVLGPVKWYDNPQGPRVEADYPTVSDEDREACIKADEDRSAPATYNNEIAYFDCLEKAIPEVKWRDNPQGPRIEADYIGVVSDEALDYCRYYDEEPTSQSYNNEIAYFDCLDPYLPVAQPEPLPESPALACAQQNGLEPEYSDQTGLVTITNAHNSAITIQRLDADGTGTFVTNMEPGEVREIKQKYDGLPVDPKRRVVFLGFDWEGTCIGAGKPRESRNSFTFGEAGSVDANPPASQALSWRDNPQGPRYLENYVNRVSQEAMDYCRYYDEEPGSQTYNNEFAFFDCLDPYLPAEPAPAVMWRDNPQGPRVEADYVNVVSQEALDYCRYNDVEPTSQTYNDEVAFFDCLDPYLPAEAVPVAKWRDDPQGPRVEADYVNAVSQEAQDYCRYYDEEPTSQTYNDETAYFDCLDPYLPAAGPTDVATGPAPQPGNQELNTAQLCARQYGLEAEYDDQTGFVTLTNNFNNYIDVHQVRANGTSSQVMYLESGQSTELTTLRRVVFVGFDPEGNCIGAGKPYESSNSITLGEGRYVPPEEPLDQTDNDGADAGNVGGTEVGSSSAQLCASQYDLEAEYSDQTGQVTITNGAASYIEVQRVDAGGASQSVAYLEAGQSTEITSQRRAVFVGLDYQGYCIGAEKLWGSRGNFTFPTVN